MDLERELSALAAHVEWPATPTLRPALVPRRRSRRALGIFAILDPLSRIQDLRVKIALALLAVALAAAFAVPQSRGAILRFLHLRGATVEIVDRLPPAEERPLGAGLGGVVDLRAARLAVPELLLPRLARLPQLHLRENVVSLVFAYRGEPVLLTEYRLGGGILLKKAAAGATRIRPVRVGRDFGLWLEGGEHVLELPGAPRRLAGNVLVWETRVATYRLEGRTLTRVDAIALARSLRQGGADTPYGW